MTRSRKCPRMVWVFSLEFLSVFVFIWFLQVSEGKEKVKEKGKVKKKERKRKRPRGYQLVKETSTNAAPHGEVIGEADRDPAAK